MKLLAAFTARLTQPALQVSATQPLVSTPESPSTKHISYRIFHYNISRFPIHWRASCVLFAIMLSTIVGLSPSLSHAAVEFWIPCSGSKAKSEGRTVDIRTYLKVDTIGMRTDDVEDLYCVTRVKCVALGHCKASTPAEQAAAVKLKRELAAEELRLQRERKAKAAQAERDRKKAEAAAAVEKARKEKLVAAEAKRLKLSAQDAQRLVETREEARKKMPERPKKCTLDYPAYTQKLNLTPTILLQVKAERDYAAIDRSKMCNGHPGKLDPLQCEKPTDFFGARYAHCTALKHCPARQESKPCNRTSIQ